MDNTDDLANKIISGRQYYAANSVEGQIWKFLQLLDQGVADMSYEVPNGDDVAGGGGSPGYVNNLGGYSNTDESVLTSIVIRRLEEKK